LVELLTLSQPVGVLPVDVDAVKSPVGDQTDGAAGEPLPRGLTTDGSLELALLGPGEASNGQECLQTSVLLLEDVELLDVAVGVVARLELVAGKQPPIVGPRVGRDSVVARLAHRRRAPLRWHTKQANIHVSLRVDIRKGVDDVRHVLDVELLGHEVERFVHVPRRQRMVSNRRTMPQA
jgi:hypothetical protein